MTTTTTRKRETPGPREAPEVRLDVAPTYRPSAREWGRAGQVVIDRQAYLILCLGCGPEDGFRLVKLGKDEKVYDLDCSGGYPLCECGDATFRQRACKHALSLVELRRRQEI